MKCSDERCTGNHNDRKYETLCPRSQRRKGESSKQYRTTHHEDVLNKDARYRTTSAYMLSQVRYEARRRGGRG